jgi:hypothetical protein
MAYNDPRWIVSKFSGVDRKGNAYSKGDRVFYYPSTKAVYAGKAADEAASDFNAMKADEDFYNHG